MWEIVGLKCRCRWGVDPTANCRCHATQGNPKGKSKAKAKAVAEPLAIDLWHPAADPGAGPGPAAVSVEDLPVRQGHVAYLERLQIAWETVASHPIFHNAADMSPFEIEAAWKSGYVDFCFAILGQGDAGCVAAAAARQWATERSLDSRQHMTLSSSPWPTRSCRRELGVVQDWIQHIARCAPQ